MWYGVVVSGNISMCYVGGGLNGCDICLVGCGAYVVSGLCYRSTISPEGASSSQRTR